MTPTQEQIDRAHQIINSLWYMLQSSRSIAKERFVLKISEALAAEAAKAHEKDAKIAESESECVDGELYIARKIARRIRALIPAPETTGRKDGE